MEQLTSFINKIKSKDKKIRYKALDEIMKLSRSRKIKQKTEILKILNEKSFSEEWEVKKSDKVFLSIMTSENE